jgi:hypothetical protein
LKAANPVENKSTNTVQSTKSTNPVEKPQRVFVGVPAVHDERQLHLQRELHMSFKHYQLLGLVSGEPVRRGKDTVERTASMR